LETIGCIYDFAAHADTLDVATIQRTGTLLGTLKRPNTQLFNPLSQAKIGCGAISIIKFYRERLREFSHSQIPAVSAVFDLLCDSSKCFSP
jgi:hypothetical protein